MADYYVAFYKDEVKQIGVNTDDKPIYTKYKTDIICIESEAFSNADEAIENFLDYFEPDYFAYLLEVTEDGANKLDWGF